MRLFNFKKSATLIILMVFFSSPLFADDDENSERKYKNQEFKSGIIVKINGKPYYFGGMPVGNDGATDIPGHSWVKISKNKLIGHHNNTNSFWSTDAGEGALLYVVEAVIDTWSEVKASKYFARGFTHHHHMVSVKTGIPHPKKVAWLKHVAVTDFSLDNGPHPELYHSVESGVDFKFVPNWAMPYDPMHHMP